ncbi:hypothetical protein [Herbaspirillum huttiense]|uniref:Uncharacterized protein n=1 Tax=Herbaspirillum huttiense subsp. lycopersici TaxID=3074428 RepID=A0ABU2EG59_9BURK|nr:hypothetical protein [Herbaspirillum huttiense]MDR9847124.1 hypothetical protein [Herbaspirillum huttiense SE1]
MKRGTYSEAILVGFCEEQAGFLGRLSCETTNEAVQEAVKIIREDEQLKKSKQQHRLTKVAICVGGTLAAIAVGYWAGAPLTFGLLFQIGYGLGHAAQ